MFLVVNIRLPHGRRWTTYKYCALVNNYLPYVANQSDTTVDVILSKVHEAQAQNVDLREQLVEA